MRLTARYGRYRVGTDLGPEVRNAPTGLQLEAPHQRRVSALASDLRRDFREHPLGSRPTNGCAPSLNRVSR
jgi:hypothetical protein